MNLVLLSLLIEAGKDRRISFFRFPCVTLDVHAEGTRWPQPLFRKECVLQAVLS